MGKKGIPMTILMQEVNTNPTLNTNQPMGGPDGNYTGTWGSMYYENGKATMTASAFNAGGNV